MRDCLILVADKSMGVLLRAAFARANWHRDVGCDRFAFDPSQDLIVAAGQNDPGIYVRGHELIRVYARSHRHALVLLDEAWQGSPGKAEIERRIAAKLVRTGWRPERSAVVAIRPELDVWLWMDDPVLPDMLGFPAMSDLRSWLRGRGLWPEEVDKPPQPKAALEASLRRIRKPPSAALYGRVADRARWSQCRDGCFRQMREILQTWFPCG